MIVTKINQCFISRMLQRKWKGGFSWQIGEPSSLPGKVTKSQLTNLVKKSLDAWARVAKLQFQHKTYNADTTITFQKLGNHPRTDWCPKYFRKTELAHASIYEPNYVHINGDRPDWVHKKGKAGTPILELVAHELGHNLGLGHTHNDGDLMNPINQKKSYEYVQFSSADIQSIRAIHGAPVNTEKRRWTPAKRGGGRNSWQNWIKRG